MIEGQEGVSWEQWRRLADACEEHGIRALFRSDHYLPLDGQHDREVLDAWGTVCALAATTSSLELGTLVSPATFRHPANLAKLAATAHEISGGRVSLGLGAGWHAGEHAAFGFPFAPTTVRMDVFSEQLEIVHALLRGRTTFSGKHYTVDVDPRPTAEVPIVVGGSGGRRSVALAARLASEYNTPFASLEQVRERRAAAVRAWEEAGRDDLRFSLMTGVIAGRDEAEAAERARAVAERRGAPGWEPDGSWLVGGPDRLGERLDALAAAGVDRVMCQLLLHDDLEQVALLGELSA